jgi:hypothetical protein
MAHDISEILQVLRYELNYLEQGGFARDRALLGTESPFRGTFACLNFRDALEAHACRECLLYQFVPDDKRNQELPCHHILLDDRGATIQQCLDSNDPERMANLLKHWLQTTITQLEATLDRSAQS